MKVRLKEGAAPITFGPIAAPPYPTFFAVPERYSSGALRALEDGQLEYAPREAPPPAPAKVDRKGYAARRPVAAR